MYMHIIQEDKVNCIDKTNMKEIKKYKLTINTTV